MHAYGGAAIAASLLIAVLTPVGPATAESVEPADSSWAVPTASVTEDAQTIVESSGKEGSMTVLYSVRNGDDLVIKTRKAADAADAERIIAQLQSDPNLLSVEINQRWRVPEDPSVSPDTTFIDPYRQYQWALDQLQAEQAWGLSTGAGQTIAVIDSGVRVHEDLTGRFAQGTDFVDIGGNGRLTGDRHGTAVAGVIAMQRNNNLGGAGLAPDAAIMPVRILDDSGVSDFARLAKGIDFAVNNGATVINLSLASTGSSTTVQVAIQRAISGGIDVVAAVGNEFCQPGYSGYGCPVWNPIEYPSSEAGVIGVASTAQGDNQSSWFSNAGTQVDIAAPGEDILSVDPDDPALPYDLYDGTSFSTPLVSATLALLRSREAALGVNVDQVSLMYQTARELGDVGRDDLYGYGLVQPYAALQRIQPPPPPPPAPPAPVTPPAPAPAPVKTGVAVSARKQGQKVRFRIMAGGRYTVALQRKVPGSWVNLAKKSGVRGYSWYKFGKAYRGKLRVSASNATHKGTSRMIVVR